MAALYSPQPMLPFFARLFSVSEAESASLISWSLLSMSIGPLFMGYLLQRYSPKHMLSCCIAGLAFCTLAFPIAGSLGLMKLMRFILGGLISAQLAATMTYIAGASTNMRQVMGFYVGAAVMGGLSGRIIAGFVTEYFDWRLFFFALGVALLFCLFKSFQLSDTKRPEKGEFSFRKLWRVLDDRYIRRLYIAIMSAFFVMTGILNFVPFRLEALDPSFGESLISLFYLGFVFGFFVSVSAPQIADLVGGTMRAAFTGITAIVLGLGAASLPSVVAVFIAVALVTSGFFLLHTSTATLLNTYAGDHAGKVNSLYIAIYYLGGSAGSYLPGLLYVSHGWMHFLGLLSVSVFISIVILASTRQPGNAFLKVS